ncbi:MAG: XRE family transcriptional regulator [Bryobacteraceae bacterium]
MPRNFRELEKKMSPERIKRSNARVDEMIQAMPLNELRAARELTQQNLSAILGVNQAAVSKLERRTDMYISTLGDFIKAMGGRLEIRAVFPDGVVTIEKFGDRVNTF